MGKRIDRIGEEIVNNQGIKMKIISYRNVHDIDIEFEDNYIAYNKNYSSFLSGGIKNKNYNNPQMIDRTGETNINNQGIKMTIIKYNGIKEVEVEFEDRVKRKCEYKIFKSGQLTNPNYKSVYSIGYLGEGVHKTKINNKASKTYVVWQHMLQRCYDKEFQKTNTTYKGCSVCEEWHNFQNFAEWFNKNYYTIGDEVIALDKDILIKDNKLYSPETCVFVPQRINSLFVKCNKIRGYLPIGVIYREKSKKYEARCSANKFLKHIGYYNTSKEAFNAYKQFKENYIKQVADEYKNDIPKKLYKAMYNYEVEITD